MAADLGINKVKIRFQLSSEDCLEVNVWRQGPDRSLLRYSLRQQETLSAAMEKWHVQQPAIKGEKATRVIG